MLEESAEVPLSLSADTDETERDLFVSAETPRGDESGRDRSAATVARNERRDSGEEANGSDMRGSSRASVDEKPRAKTATGGRKKHVCVQYDADIGGVERFGL